MAWVATDEDGTEGIYGSRPWRAGARTEKEESFWTDSADYVELPKGSIKKLIGRTLTWADDPVELKEEEGNGE